MAAPVAEKPLTLADIVDVARTVGRELADSMKTPGQREFEANQRLDAERAAARLAVSPLLPLPEIGGKEKALALLDAEHAFHLRHQYSHVERRGRHEVVHHGPAVVRLTVREAMRAGAARAERGARITMNTAAWEEAGALATLLRELQARECAEVARFANGLRSAEPLPLAVAIMSPLVAVRVEGGRGEHRSIAVPEHPAAW